MHSQAVRGNGAVGCRVALRSSFKERQLLPPPVEVVVNLAVGEACRRARGGSGSPGARRARVVASAARGRVARRRGRASAGEGCARRRGAAGRRRRGAERRRAAVRGDAPALRVRVLRVGVPRGAAAAHGASLGAERADGHRRRCRRVHRLPRHHARLCARVADGPGPGGARRCAAGRRAARAGVGAADAALVVAVGKAAGGGGGLRPRVLLLVLLLLLLLLVLVLVVQNFLLQFLCARLVLLDLFRVLCVLLLDHVVLLCAEPLQDILVVLSVRLLQLQDILVVTCLDVGQALFRALPQLLLHGERLLELLLLRGILLFTPHQHNNRLGRVPLCDVAFH
eukprot:Rhum_TRINITY_DN12594_c0_g1::Rhum_TRINITY_DN12594_c0_g1_i1::g.53056::m.53056